MVSLKWDLRFLEMARLVASWSKDPSTKAGAVIVDPNRRIISMGYNGLPQPINDEKNYHLLTNRELKYKVIIHAERNALLFAQRDLSNCTIYNWPFMSCPVCTSLIIQTGIKRIVSPLLTKDSEKYDRWHPEFEISRMLCSEAGIQLTEIHLPMEVLTDEKSIDLGSDYTALFGSLCERV